MCATRACICLSAYTLSALLALAFFCLVAAEALLALRFARFRAPCSCRAPLSVSNAFVRHAHR
jgi:hypothetical protein